MRKRQSSISISKLARFATEPSSVFQKDNAGAIRYGNAAHKAIGRGPSLIIFIFIAAVVVLAAIKVGIL